MKTKSGEWIESTQLLYDMGYEVPNGNGADLIAGFLRGRFSCRKNLDLWLRSMFHKWDKESYMMSNEDEISYLLDTEIAPKIDGVGDDYSYIMNCSSTKDKIYVAGEEVVIEKNEMIILCFSQIVLRLRRKPGKVALAFDQGEVNICTEALDFYNRMFMGQYDNIISRLSWRQPKASDMHDDRYVSEHVLMAIREIVMKDTVLAGCGFNASLGIWHEQTDIKAVNSYDIQQIMRFNLAYAIHPEGGYSVDFGTPLIRGNLPAIVCECEKMEDNYVEEITCTTKHLQILDDALLVFSLLHRMKMSSMFKYYTEDEIALELAGGLDKLFLKYKTDSKFIGEIEKVRKKVVYAGGVDMNNN